MTPFVSKGVRARREEVTAVIRDNRLVAGQPNLYPVTTELTGQTDGKDEDGSGPDPVSRGRWVRVTVTTAGRYEPYLTVGYHRPGEDLPAVNVRLYPGSYALAAEVSYGDTPDEWALRVGGTVAQPLCLDWNDIGSYPKESFTADFACVEGWTAAALSWRGIRIGTLLEQADPTPTSSQVVVRGMDSDYTCAFPIDRVRDAILALELDGEPLAVNHGGPARLVPTDSGSDC